MLHAIPWQCMLRSLYVFFNNIYVHQEIEKLVHEVVYQTQVPLLALVGMALSFYNLTCKNNNDDNNNI